MGTKSPRPLLKQLAITYNKPRKRVVGGKSSSTLSRLCVNK
nr:MAG TPA: hypothetical protein [Caudoviricetes sp.]DAO63563.1 MAG TPA: hypothetical protein [Caudoviricetes sp.]DAU22067.1 MAG TPA: hypothetical protein [Caudoviricetes sp.]